jgi:sugar fermentation stimulation protein A
MIYSNSVEGIFIERINRFIAKVRIHDIIETVHVKNTGRCKELFIQGATVYLEKSNNPNRKTQYSLISIYKENRLINIDSQVPNEVVYESLLLNLVKEIAPVTLLKREVTFGDSRFDLYYETIHSKGFIEVKGVTLENKGIALFPDAPTSRGSKHLKGLIEGIDLGYVNFIFFLIQMDGITDFMPNQLTDPIFSNLVFEAKKRGVTPLIYNCTVEKDSLVLNNPGCLLPL